MRLLMIIPALYTISGKKVTPFWMPPLGLATIAAEVPEYWDVKIIDENVDELDVEHEEANLVVISFLTTNSVRGYMIADAFRRRGIKVILGGVHVSVRPEEAMQHADVICLGDSEGVFRNVISDFEHNCLKRTYERVCTADNINIFNKPRRDLYHKEKYLTINTMQTSRGCPHICSFCSVASRYHRKYGIKPIKQILEEIEEMDVNGDPVFFVDDNMFVNKKRTVELLRELKKFNLQWWTQTDIITVQDEEFLELAKESGCVNLVLGFESLSNTSVQKMSKLQNVGYSYEETIKKIHKHGIFINPSFTLGVDEDDDSVFRNIYEFLNENGVMFSTFNILTPLPRTVLYDEMEKENRIIDRDSTHYDMGHVVFKPRNMSAEALKKGHDWLCEKYYGIEDIYKRVKRLKADKDKFDINLVLGWNLGYKRLIDNFGVFM